MLVLKFPHTIVDLAGYNSGDLDCSTLRCKIQVVIALSTGAL